MAGTTPTAAVAAPAPTAGTGNATALPYTSGDYVQAPNQGNLQQRGEMGQAIGDFYSDYKRAQLAEVTDASALSKASRDRLTQIWQAGADNPQVQNDPKMHKQIAALYKNIGVRPPVNAKGQLDWSQLAPAQTLDGLSQPSRESLEEMDPARRAAAVKSMHIIGADPDWISAPAKMSPMQVQHFQTDFTQMLSGKFQNMSPSQFEAWVNSNRNHIEQAISSGATDQLLNDQSLIKDIGSNQGFQLQKMTDALRAADDKHNVTTGVTIPPAIKARIDQANAAMKNATSLTQLRDAEAKFKVLQTKDYPAEAQAKLQELQAKTKTYPAQAEHLRALTASAAFEGKNSPLAVAMAAQRDATTDYTNALRVFQQGVDAMGGASPEATEALSQAAAARDAAKTAVDYFNSPAGRQAMAANRVTTNTGVAATPVTNAGKPQNQSFVFKPTNADKDGRPAMNVNGKWVIDAKGTPANI